MRTITMMTDLKRVRKESFFLLAILFNLTLAQQDTFQIQSTRIAGSILVDGHSLDYLQDLTDGFGGRISGSTSYQQASKWAAQQFREAGIKDVKLEPFTLPNGWERVSAHARLITPLDRPLQVHSYGWARSTPKEGVEGDVVYIRHILSQEGIKSKAGKIIDHIVLINGDRFYQDERF